MARRKMPIRWWLVGKNIRQALVVGIIASLWLGYNGSSTTAALSTTTASSATELSGVVLYVVDGDTIDVDLNHDGVIDKDSERVRMLGIDTFEYFDEKKVADGSYTSDKKYTKLKKQAAQFRLTIPQALKAGQDATRLAKRDLLGKTVHLVQSGKDKRELYGRLLAYVELPDGRDWGTVLLESGLAYVYKGNTSHARYHQYVQASILER